jgi:trk system potassium uptake protein TrkA
VHGDATDAEVLKNADAENSSHLIAAMSTDEQNIVACKLAGSLFNVRTKIARIRSDSFLRDDVFELFLKDNFGIDVLIHPELEVARHAANIAPIKGAFDVIKLNQVTIAGLKCLDNTEVLNTTFKHFQGITGLDLFVLTVTRNGVTFFPSSKDLLLPDDEVYVAMNSKNINEVMLLFGYQQEKQNILILGGGNVGLFVMKMISEKNPDFNITILEKSKSRAEEISQKYNQAAVILGNALDHELLQEISSDMDTAIAATDNDEVNVLSSLFLRQFQIGRILTLSKSENYNSLLSVNSGCSIINPSAVTIESIVQKSRKGKITTTAPLKSAYVIEAEVTESCANLGEPLESLQEKDKIIPVFVIRNDEIIPAKKDTIISLNDRLIILAAKDRINSVEKIFSNYLFSKNPLYNSLY